ncbi:MAG: hypothetical protein L0241_31980, partial [Planctomycetia bacterium]|nr:hypothetical protein [Planctomycetia bacterium]
GQLVIPDWEVHPPALHASTITIAMEAGKMYDIKLEYFEATLGAQVELLWSNTIKPERVTIPKSQVYPIAFDLDVNADNDLLDTVDGAADYLPGYEGNVQKVSTGNSFNTDTYAGQRMKLVLDGVGLNNANVTKVEFVVNAVSALEGYAANRTHASLLTPTTHEDYSFHKHENYRNNGQNIYTITRTSTEGTAGPDNAPAGGQMEATKTWVNFYAKDYGGSAQVEARVYIGGAQPDYTLKLILPKDTDFDGFADKWEIQMGKRWTTQYNLPAFTVSAALTHFTPGYDPATNTYRDAELEDPDGKPQATRPLVDQSEKGDAHDIVEEYRGYILDGGGLDGNGANGHAGGHIRLDPARKEILLEVDRAEVLNNVPAGGLAGVLNGAASVFSHAPFGMPNPAAPRGAGIYVYYLFDEVAYNAPAVINAGSLGATRDTASARAAVTSQLATDFVHLLFVDTGLQIGDSAETYDTTPILERGTLIATSQLNTKYGPGNAYGVTNIPEAFMTVVAHELTHMLFERVSVGVWNAQEHVDGPLATYEAELMYKVPTKKNRELATVTILPVVQQEMKVKQNQGITP